MKIIIEVALILLFISRGNSIQIDEENGNDDSINDLKLEILEPFIVYYEGDDDIQLFIEPYGRYLIDETPNWCKVYQNGYDYRLDKRLIADQSKKQLIEANGEVIFPETLTFMDFFMLNGMLAILSSDGTYTTYNVESLQSLSSKQLLQKEDHKELKMTHNKTHVFVLSFNELNIFDVQSSQVKKLALPQNAEIQQIINYQGSIFIALKKQGILSYDDSSETLREIQAIKDAGLLNFQQLTEINGSLVVVDYEKGAYFFSFEKSSYQFNLVNKIEMPQLKFIQYQSDGTYLMVNENEIIYKNNDSINEIQIFGVDNLFDMEEYILLTGRNGAYKSSEQTNYFGQRLLLTLSNQIKKTLVFSQKVYLLTSDSLMELGVQKRKPYLQCLPTPLEYTDQDQDYGFMVIVNSAASTRQYKYRLHLVEPLITSSALPVILGAVLGTIMILAIIGGLFLYYYWRYNQQKQTVYEEIYKEEN